MPIKLETKLILIGKTMKINKKLLSYLLFLLIVQSCDCHYKNTQDYVKCLEKHKENEDFCIKIKSKYPANTCKNIDYHIGIVGN